MSERSCPNTVPCLTNMPKKKSKSNPTVTFMLPHGMGKTLPSILSPNIA